MSWRGTELWVIHTDVDANGHAALYQSRYSRDGEIGASWFLSGDILFTRVAFDGSRLIVPTAIGSVGMTDDESPPALCWTGSDYVAVWVGRQADIRYRDSVVARRLSANGTPIGAAQVIATYATVPAAGEVGNAVGVAYNGTEVAVTWVAPDGAAQVVHLAADLTLLGGPVQVTDSVALSQLVASRPRLVWTGEEWLLNYLGSPPGQAASGSYVVSVCDP